MKALLALLLLFHIATVNAADPSSFFVETNASFQDAIAKVKQAVGGHNFHVVRERDLSVNGIKIHAIWFCNFAMLNKAIQTQKKVGYMLPFRITVMERGNKISISANNPDKSMKHFKAELGSICSDVAAAYQAILDEASL